MDARANANDNGLRVLFFGSDPAPAEQFRAALALGPEPRGHLRQFEDFTDAVQALAGGATDVLILDLTHPGLTPIQAIAVMRAVAPGLPLITLLERPNSVVSAEAFRAWPGGHLLKRELTLPRAVRLLEQIPLRLRDPVLAGTPTLRTLLDAFPSAVALLDRNATVVAMNEPWRAFARENACQQFDFGLGSNYLEVCDRAQGTEGATASRAARGLRSVLAGEEQFFELVYPCHGSSAQRWFRLRVEPVLSAEPGALLVSHANVTEQERGREHAQGIIRMQQQVGIAGLRVDAITQTIVTTVRELLQATGTALAEREGAEAVLRATDGEVAGEVGLRVPIDSTLLGRCFLDGQLMRTPDVMPDSRDEQGLALGLGMRSALFVPLFGQGTSSAEVDSVLIVASSRPRAFTDADAETLQGVAGFLSTALSRARASERDEQLLREQIETLERSAKSGEGFRHIVETACEGIWTVDAANRTTFVNGRMAEMLGLAPEEMRGRPAADFLDPAWHAPALWPLTGIAEQGGIDRIQDASLLRKDGLSIHASASIASLVDREGQTIGALAMVTAAAAQSQPEEAVRKCEAQFRTIVETTIEGVWTLDAEGRTLYANRRLAEMLGCSLDELARRTIFDFIDPERQSDFRAHFALRWLGIANQYDFHFRRPDGSPIWVMISSSPLRDASGKVEAVLNMITDATAHRLARGKTSEQHELLQLLLEGAGDPVFLKNRSGEYLMVNSATAELFGRPAAQVIGHTDLEFLPHEYATKHRKDDLHVMSTGRAEEIEEMVPGPDGIRTYLATKSALRNSDGEIVGVIGIAKNISDRKRTEEALRKTTEELNNIVQASPLAIYTTNLADQVLSWNPAAHRIFGWEEHELFGRRLPSIPPEGRQQYQALLERNLAGEIIIGVEAQRLTRNGTLIDVTIATAPLRDASGAVRGTVRIVADTTAQRQLQERLRQTQKMEAIGQLASGIAHDFNNLLTAILASADFALMEVSDDHPCREDLEQIKRASQRAAGLTAQLLAFGRRQVLQPKVLDLYDVVTDVDRMLRRVIGEDIELLTTAEPGLGCVMADPGQIGQVLMNLSVNARDAMPEGGRLSIEIKRVELDAEYAATHVEVQPGPYMVLSVSDSGVGMTREIQARIFEPFFTTKDRGRGTGLGLSTSFGIVKQSGGSIWVYSEPGHGTTFRVYLPLVQGVTERRVAARTSAMPTGNETILLVDDEAVIRDVASRILGQAGYRVIAAAGPDEALALFAHTPSIDLVITDVVMPGMNGRELAERLLAIRSSLKVLFTSGYSEGIHAQTHPSGMHAPYLAKPFSADDLRQMVRKTIDAPKQRSAG